MRTHSGINQKTGKLKKGYKYSGKKLKSGLPQIVKVKITKKIQKGGEYDLNYIKKQVKILKSEMKQPTYSPVKKLEMNNEIRKLTKRYNRSMKIQDDLNKDLETYPLQT